MNSHQQTLPRFERHVNSDIDRLYASAGSRTGKLCDDCLHFREADNRCHAQDIEVPFDTPACVLFERKLTPQDYGCGKAEA